MPATGLPTHGLPALHSPVRFGATAPPHGLLDAAVSRDVRLAVVFGGQGAAWLGELRALHAAHAAVRTLVKAAGERLRAAANDPRLGALATPARGFDLARWMDEPAAAPPPEVLSSSVVSQAGIFVTSVARWVAAGERGLDLEALAGVCTATTGHSQGVMAAVLFSEARGFGRIVARAADLACYFFWQGYRMQESFVLAMVPPAVRAAAEQAGVGEPAPMAAIAGLTSALLSEALARFHAANPQLPPIDVALDNGYTRKVVSGPPVALVAFARALGGFRDAEKQAFARGRLGRRPIDFRWEFVAASAPFHSRYMEAGRRALPGDLAREGIAFSPEQLRLPVFGNDGADLRAATTELELLETLVRIQHVEPVLWAAVCATLRASHPDGITHVLDFGPGDAVAKLTALNCRGFGVHVLPLATEAGTREAMGPAAELPRGQDYRRFAPRLRREPTGEVVLDNAWRRFTGRPPVFLPGMTPTTSEAPIVAAAANAGFVSELAGGGQVTERHFRLRAAELARTLDPGAAYVVNLLYLDPYLWSLHWKGEGMISKLRAGGAAIEGITVSAGIPELEEACEIIERCRAQGLELVSFKPGTAAQVQQVLAIARACPDVTIGVQIEGGKAGGHHSWEDLRDLVRGCYSQVREQPNVVLSVGGGIRNEADAWAWLSGTWSQAIGLAPMPVDAVFLGTLTMATREAATSPQVKALLAAVPGSGEWVAAGAAKGRMTSGKSQLDADIHYIDNAAARAGRLLDEVAGNAEAVRARHDEIVAALAQTAKPYFGPLAAMSPAAVLRRMVDLMAIGRSTEYEDGRFPDPSFRQRLLDMALRFEERLAERAGASIVTGPADLDEPVDFVDRFVAAYPRAEHGTVAQADVDFFVHRVCSRPGKPVNFVPVIDADVRRWYKADSLWQSHDDRYPADAVLVIPGPEAVQGISVPDEPVGGLLRRFVDFGIARLLAEGQTPDPAPDAIDFPALVLAAVALGVTLSSGGDGVFTGVCDGPTEGGASPVALARWLSALDSAVLAPLVRRSGVLRGADVCTNPLARLLRVGKGDRWTAQADTSGRLSALEVRRESGHGLELTLSRDGHLGRCEVTLIHALPPDRQGRGAVGAEVRLTLAFEHDLRHGGRFPREVTPDRTARIGAFYRAAMIGETAPVPAGDEVRTTFTVDRAFVREYALAAGDASVAHLGGRGRGHIMPLNAAFSAAFGAIFRATHLPGVSWDHARLVHLENEIRAFGPLPQEDDVLEVTARLTAWEPARGGVRIRTEAVLRMAGPSRASMGPAGPTGPTGLRCTIACVFFVQGETSVFRFREETSAHQLPAGDPALMELLLAKAWVTPVGGAADGPHEVALELSTRTDLTVTPTPTHGRVRGTLTDETGRLVARIHAECPGQDAAEAEPARWFGAFAPVASEAVSLPRPSAAYIERTSAPWNLAEFARASHDANPLHRDAHAAALAGFDRPIVHGQWTAARAVAAVAAGFAGTDGERIRSISATFTDVVLPGDALELRARHAGMQSGDLLVDVEAHAGGPADPPNPGAPPDSEPRMAFRGRIRVAAPRTAYVFPGQGVQTAGMGMDGYGRSPAARSVWDAADAHCRDRLGFSLLTVVRDNPLEMRVGKEILRHEQGVLFLTQFTQVGMAVLACAQIEELREAGCFQDDAPFCGHSVGEYSAIGALTDALSLTAVVDCVYQRGLTMQHYVPRDAHGRSAYRMAVVRPNIVGMNEAALKQLVERIARESGLLCELVNYNIRGRQYSVVGHVPALEALRAELRRREPPGAKPTYLEVPGIDVPFHSRALRDGVAAFRQKLEEIVPLALDVTPLVGRYIPNLVARLFEVTRSYLDEMITCTDSGLLNALRDQWDAEAEAPVGLGRALFIEGLAYQFASPVRWIETQDILLARDRTGVARIIEIGLGSAPTQANMFKATLSMEPSRLDPPGVLNVEGDRKLVFHLYDAEPEMDLSSAAPAPAVGTQAPEPATGVVEAARRPTAGSATPITDAAPTVRDGLLTLLALKTRVRLDEIRPDENIELLTGGNSSRRNQVMADLGNEFSIGSIDAAHEMALGALVAAVEKATSGRYKAPGPFLRAQVTAALKPFGLSVKDVLTALSSRGLPEGRALGMLNRAALWLRTGDSTRSGPLSPLPLPAVGDRNAAAAWIDAALARFAQEEGFSLGAGAGAGAGGATVDAAALEGLLGRYFGVGGAFLESLRFAESALGRDVWAELEARTAEHGTAPPSEDTDRLARYDAEHGADYDKTIRPAFTPEKAVVYSGAWAWARRDAFALFHDLRAGRVSAGDLPELEARISRGADAAVARTVAHLERRARGHGDLATAEVFARLFAGIDPSRIPTARSEAVPLAPAVEVLPDGRLAFSERLRGEPTAVAVARELIDGRHVSLALHGVPGAGMFADRPPLHGAGFPDERSTQGPAQAERTQALFETSIEALAHGEATFAGRTALVTGASERSIAIELVKLLLTGGARVVVTTSNLTPERVRFYRRLFQLHGARGAELAVVPFNQGSRQDIQRLVNWLVSTEKTTVGGTQRTVKEPWLVDLLVPFGAVGEEATLADLSDRSMATLRVLLYGVEALVAECAQAFSRLHVHESRTHVLLPLSPNHGQFGNDGLYGETKAALEAMLNRWSSEHAAWGRHASLVGARIGWVRGTGLMNVNNAIAPGLEASVGVRTFSSAEMGLLLGALCAEPIRALAADVPLVADLTGGMAAVRDLAGVARSLRAGLTAQVSRAKRLHALRRDEERVLGQLRPPPRRVEPTPRFSDHFAFPPLPLPARRAALIELRALDLSRIAVIVGLGEVGPWGSARTRWSMESTGELSLEACVELSWLTGRIRYEKSRQHVGWVDVVSGEAVREQDVKTRYEAALLEDSGIRIVDPAVQNGFDPRKMKVWADVVLERDFVFPVPGQSEGQAFVEAAGEGARLIFDREKDGWFVVRPKGSVVKVARAARLNRYVAGQIPKGWDAVRFGIPRDMADQVDRTTLFNLVATVDAFLSAGMEPEELYRYLHPSDVGNTQGAGIGGMQKLERLYLDHPLDRPRQGDALQETLINVTAAWIVQSIVGSYGPMVHPVGACATAAVSVEVAAEKVLGGKAAFIVAGGFDDYGEEGAVGFADMAATADTDDMLARGIPPREMSRPNDRRRRGFVEAQGGGTLLICRADVAIRMGLPVYAAVALARSYGDGIHRSIPAPGPGVMAVAAERRPRNGEATGAALCELSTRASEWQRVQGLFAQLRDTLGEAGLQHFERAERRRLFHELHAGDERISPLRRALAVFGLRPDDIAAAWKHDTSTDANDPNENRAYDRIMRWLGREAGNPLVVVSQKSLTGHSKGGAAAWQATGLCQAMASGRVPGNLNLDDPDPAMRAYETVLFTDRPIDFGPDPLEAGIVTSLGFGHVGAILCLVHPDRVLAALDDTAFTAYAARRDAREQLRVREQLAVLEAARPAVRIRTEKSFQVPADAAYAGFDAEHAVLLDAASRRLDDTGPIVAGGVAEGLAGPEAEQAAPVEV